MNNAQDSLYKGALSRAGTLIEDGFEPVRMVLVAYR